MNYSTAVMLINDNIRAVKGKYEERGNDTVFKTLDPELKVGDYAVVESGTRWGMTTVQITAVDVDVDYDSPKEMHWVVGKVDADAHEKIKEMEAQAIEMIKRGELRKRREDIKKNTLDALTNGELADLDIAKIGVTAITDGTKGA